MDEAGGRVIAAGGLALVAAGGVQTEIAALEVELGMQLEQGLVDAAQLLGAEVAVIDLTAAAAVADDREVTDGLEKIAVGYLRPVQIGRRLAGKEERAERGQAQLGRAALVAQLAQHDCQALVKVGMLAAAAAGGKTAQAAGGIVFIVAPFGLIHSLGQEQQPALLGDEEKDQTVDQTQELAVKVLLAEFGRVEPLPQGFVSRVTKEAAAEGGDGRFDAAAQLVEGAGALLLRQPGPALQPALFGPAGLDARLVAEKPEQDEIGIDLALHHRLEVEFNPGLAGEADIVAQDAQPAAVGEKGPEPVVGAVEQLLHHAVGRAAAGSGHSGAAPVEVDAPADEMNGQVLPGVGDRVAFALDLDGAGRSQAAVAELAEEVQQPFLAGEGGGGIAFRPSGEVLLKGRPGADEAVPGAAGHLVDLFALDEMIGLRGEPLQSGITGSDALQQLRRQDGPFDMDGGEKIAVAGLHDSPIIYHKEHEAILCVLCALCG